METNNQDQVKDLQYWKDFLAKKNGWNSYEQWKNHENLHEENLTLKAIDLMVNDRVQQAKDAAFKEGEGLLSELEKWSQKYELSFQFWGEGNNNVFIEKGGVELTSSGGRKDLASAIIFALNYLRKINRQAPYTTGEKGGE